MLKSQSLEIKITELQAEETRLKIKANDERYVGASPEQS